MEERVSILDELREAADGSTAGCKLCTILDALPNGEGENVNTYLTLKRGDAWKISAEKGVAILRKYGIVVGPTTLRTHRNQGHTLNP
jgi:hypothetical protein